MTALRRTLGLSPGTTWSRSQVGFCYWHLLKPPVGHDVFHLNHEEAKDLIRQGGNKLLLVVERGEMIVPSMNSAFPKPKSEDVVDKPKSYSQEVLERTGRLPGQKEQGFTTIGKAKMASKQYNSPMKMYSEDIIEEIMTQVTCDGWVCRGVYFLVGWCVTLL